MWMEVWTITLNWESHTFSEPSALFHVLCVMRAGSIRRYVPYLAQGVRHGLQDIGVKSVTELYVTNVGYSKKKKKQQQRRLIPLSRLLSSFLPSYLPLFSSHSSSFFFYVVSVCFKTVAPSSSYFVFFLLFSPVIRRCVLARCALKFARTRPSARVAYTTCTLTRSTWAFRKKYKKCACAVNQKVHLSLSKRLRK